MLEIALAPLAVTAKNFSVGDKVRVSVAFKYTVLVDSTIYLYAGPCYSNILGKHLVGSCTGQAAVSLKATSTPEDKTAAVDFTLVPLAQNGIENGTYGLVVWARTAQSSSDPWVIPGPLAKTEQDGVLIVAGNPSGGGILDSLSSMMPMIMMLMMLGMVTPMLKGMSGEEE